MKKKVLLIKLSAMGDVIFNIPLANALKAAGYELTWLVSEKGFQLVNNNPCVDKTILVPLKEWKKLGCSVKNFVEYIKLLKELRAEKFDVAIDAQMMFKSLFLLLLCGAKRRITSKKALELSFLGGNEWVNDVSYKPDTQIVINYLKYADYMGIHINKEDIDVTLPPRTKEQIENVNNLLLGIDNSKPTVAIAPATTWKNKHWNKDNWKTVVEYLAPKCNLVFTGGKDDNELINYISDETSINIAGKTDVLELAEVFSRCSLVISPDSGSAHLAWAVRNPKVLTIFTCTPKNVLGPIGSDDKYVSLCGSELPCQPCFKRKCSLKNNKNSCTNFPTVEEVIDNINKLIF